MCRNIKTLYNYAPPATPEEVRSAAVQYVRKVSGVTRPSAANAAAVDEAVAAVTEATQQLLDAMVTSAPPKDRAVEMQKLVERSRIRFGREPKG